LSIYYEKYLENLFRKNLYNRLLLDEENRKV
jgi:hypothetical protein